MADRSSQSEASHTRQSGAKTAVLSREQHAPGSDSKRAASLLDTHQTGACSTSVLHRRKSTGQEAVVLGETSQTKAVGGSSKQPAFAFSFVGRALGLGGSDKAAEVADSTQPPSDVNPLFRVNPLARHRGECGTSAQGLSVGDGARHSVSAPCTQDLQSKSGHQSCMEGHPLMSESLKETLSTTDGQGAAPITVGSLRSSPPALGDAGQEGDVGGGGEAASVQEKGPAVALSSIVRTEKRITDGNPATFNPLHAFARAKPQLTQSKSAHGPEMLGPPSRRRARRRVRRASCMVHTKGSNATQTQSWGQPAVGQASTLRGWGSTAPVLAFHGGAEGPRMRSTLRQKGSTERYTSESRRTFKAARLTRAGLSSRSVMSSLKHLAPESSSESSSSIESDVGGFFASARFSVESDSSLSSCGEPSLVQAGVPGGGGKASTAFNSERAGTHSKTLVPEPSASGDLDEMVSGSPESARSRSSATMASPSLAAVQPPNMAMGLFGPRSSRALGLSTQELVSVAPSSSSRRMERVKSMKIGRDRVGSKSSKSSRKLLQQRSTFSAMEAKASQRHFRREVQKVMENCDTSCPTRIIRYCAVDRRVKVDVVLAHRHHWATCRSCGWRYKHTKQEVPFLLAREGVDSLPSLSRALQADRPAEALTCLGRCGRWQRSVCGLLGTGFRLLCSWTLRMALCYDQVSILMNALLFFAVFGSLINSVSGADLYIEFFAVVLLFVIGILPTVIVELSLAVMYIFWHSIALKELGIESNTQKIKQHARNVAEEQSKLFQRLAISARSRKW